MDEQVFPVELAPDTSVYQQPGSTAVLTPEPTTITEPVITSNPEQDILRLDRKQLAAEFDRLQREDPEAANILNAMVGRKAAKAYKPQLDALQAKLEATNSELRRREILAMSDQEIERKFATDPKFAEEYARIVHDKPETRAAAEEQRTKRTALEDVLIEAAQAGVPRERAETLLAHLERGGYDRDENGNELHWGQGLARLQRDLLIAAPRFTPQPEARSASPSTPPPPSTPQAAAPRANPNLLVPGPDTTTTGVVSAARGSLTAADYQRAIKEGRELSSEERDSFTKRWLSENGS